jgi:hypothetical protein
MNAFYYSLRRDIGRLNIVIDNVHYFIQKSNCQDETAFEQLSLLCKDYSTTKEESILTMIHQLARYGVNVEKITDFDYVKHQLFITGSDVPVPNALVTKLGYC